MTRKLVVGTLVAALFLSILSCGGNENRDDEGKAIRAAMEVSPGTKDSEGRSCAQPPKDVQEILSKLSKQAPWTFGDEGKASLEAGSSQLTDQEMHVLNSFAAKVAGRNSDECKIRAIYGCRSCDFGCRGIGRGCYTCRDGNRVITDCGEQCWLCAIWTDC